MKPVLHITNGDSFTEKLRSLPIEGDIITWREMLCEGQTLSQVGSESFWKTRFEFFSKNYQVTKSWFVEKTLKEYRALCNHKHQDHIVLWFEYDLFCQVNMLAIVSWLKAHKPHARIELVCSGETPGSDRLLGLCELSDESLMELYRERVELQRDDIEFADYLWQLYCSDNPIRLEQVGGYGNYNFKYLEGAIQAHLRRFPSLRNGLNAIENTALKTAHYENSSSKRALVGKLLGQQEWYGFGDVQYERVLERLAPLFAKWKPVRLNDTGLGVLEGGTNYYAHLRSNDQYLGGALKYNFLYNHNSQRILKL